MKRTKSVLKAIKLKTSLNKREKEYLTTEDIMKLKTILYQLKLKLYSINDVYGFNDIIIFEDLLDNESYLRASIKLNSILSHCSKDINYEMLKIFKCSLIY